MQSISGTMLRDLLLCERRFELDLREDASARESTSAFVEMLWREGLAHESEILFALPGPVSDFRGLSTREQEAATLEAIAARSRTILGAALTCGDMVGMPDVLRWTEAGYVAMDVKAGSAMEGPRENYKPAYLVQVAHYAFLLESTGLGRGDIAGIIDRDGKETMYDLSRPFGRDRASGRDRHLKLLAQARRIRDGQQDTRGALSAICGMCDWRRLCKLELRETDDLTQLAGLGRSIRDAMEPIARTVTQLANVTPDTSTLKDVGGIGAERLARFVARARLWSDKHSGPVRNAPLRLPSNPHRIDFDVEADPLRGIVYLHGFWHDRTGTDGEFVHFFAPTIDEAGEREAFAAAMEHFKAHRSAHWYHYSAYERTAYRGLQKRHPSVCSEHDIADIFLPERCTDLYQVISRHTDWPLSSYGIKSIAKACGFDWTDVDPSGANSIQWFDDFARTGDPALRQRIIDYNRDDVIASARVRDALIELDEKGQVDNFRRPEK